MSGKEALKFPSLVSAGLTESAIVPGLHFRPMTFAQLRDFDRVLVSGEENLSGSIDVLDWLFHHNFCDADGHRFEGCDSEAGRKQLIDQLPVSLMTDVTEEIMEQLGGSQPGNGSSADPSGSSGSG